MKLKKETQFLKQVQVLSESESLKYHKKLLKIGRIFSEQYICHFILPCNVRETLSYHTENKNMHSQVEKRFRADFPNAELIDVVYC